MKLEYFELGLKFDYFFNVDIMIHQCFSSRHNFFFFLCLVAASPNSKAQIALYKDFGTQFLVAGTEKKLRFYPDKVSSESVDDVRERDRSERYVHFVSVFLHFLYLPPFLFPKHLSSAKKSYSHYVL